MKKQILIFTILFLAISARTSVAQYADLHDFNCATEGCSPSPPTLMAQGRDGNLYSTTLSGPGTNGVGTAFRVTPGGVLTTLHVFNDAVTGRNPYGGLSLASDGNFYGTASEGGPNGWGTIFRMTPSGVVTVLHSFDFSGKAGRDPHIAPIQASNGSLYGGTDHSLFPYHMTLGGSFAVCPNAISDVAFSPLIQAADGYLYGTTSSGGALGYGSVFRLSLACAVKTIYSFDLFGSCHCTNPNGPLTQASDGNFYGTAQGGNNDSVVFKLTPSGGFTVLHNFDRPHGANPIGGLIVAPDGNLYGITSNGGTNDDGTIFRLTKTGQSFVVLHNFDGVHGGTPVSIMQHTNGTLYGLTQNGGAHGKGVFFSFKAGLPSFVALLTASGKAGQTVQILGTGLTGTTSVKFGSGSASFTVASNTYMTAIVPTTGTTGAVSVTTPTGIRVSNKIFKVIPSISSFSPTSGPVGTKVVIKGSGVTQTTKVTFGDVTASFVVNSATQVTATVPTAAITSKITITTPGGVATSVATFTVTNSLIGRCVVSNGKMTGYCVGVRSGICREAYDPADCPVGQSVTNVVLDQCAQSTFHVNGSRGCVP